jgi:hypothetical protein
VVDVFDASGDLLDAAFGLSINAFNAAGHAKARNRLWQDFPWVDFNSISEAYLAACRLHRFAFTVIAKNQESQLSSLEIMACLREQCPGFAERTYSKAIFQACFENR